MQIRPSTIIGQAVMDAIDAGMHVDINIHGMPEAESEQLLGRLASEHGYMRDDMPSNDGHRGAKLGWGSPDINIWPPRACP